MAQQFKIRIETLSDLVFGLALSIGSIALLAQPHDGMEDVFRGLMWFTFSFLILISMWLTYSKIMSSVRMETSWALRLNIALLLLVIIEPYLLNILAFDASFQNNPSLMDASTSLYALDLAGIWMVMAGLLHIAMKQQGGSRVLRNERNLRLVYAAVFLISALPVFWTISLMGIHFRYVIWLLALPIGAVVERWILPTEPANAAERA